MKLIQSDIFVVLNLTSILITAVLFFQMSGASVNQHECPLLGVGGVLTAVFLGSPLKCPNSKHFFFQDGVDEGQRHRPVASQQTGLHGRALDAS